MPKKTASKPATKKGDWNVCEKQKRSIKKSKIEIPFGATKDRGGITTLLGK